MGVVSGPGEFEDVIGIDLPIVFDDAALGALLETDQPGAYVIEWALAHGNKRIPLRTDEATITGRDRDGERIRVVADRQGAFNTNPHSGQIHPTWSSMIASAAYSARVTL